MGLEIENQERGTRDQENEDKIRKKGDTQERRDGGKKGAGKESSRKGGILERRETVKTGEEGYTKGGLKEIGNSGNF